MSYANDFCPVVATYYQDLKKCKPITRVEENRLIRLAKNNDKEARDKILTSNLQFVFDVAKKYRGYGADMPDLIAEGNMGLTKAIYRFDETRGVKFISYAVWWVKQSILEYLRKTGRAANNEVGMDEINRSCIEKKPAPVDPEYDDTLSDEYPDIEVYEDDEEAEEYNSETVGRLLSVLNDRERNVITMYYGIGGEEETLDEIGDSLGITKERVRQIKSCAIRKMRSEAMTDNNIF
jgi:RNA polymerase primary sigma factor